MADGTVQRIDINAPLVTVYAVASDLAEYPDWAQGVRSVSIDEVFEDGSPHRAVFTIDGMMKEITYELVYEHDAPTFMSWVAVPGADIKAMDGSYEFTERADGSTSVVYTLKVETAFKVPGFLFKQAEKTIVSAALRGLKRRAESLATE